MGSFWRKLNGQAKTTKHRQEKVHVAQKLHRLSDEINRLESELDKLAAQCEAYEEALMFADVLAEIAKNAYWGSDRAKREVQKLIDQYSHDQGIWHNWEQTVKDVKSGDAMRRIMATRIA